MADSRDETGILIPEQVLAYKELINASGILKTVEIDNKSGVILKDLKSSPAPVPVNEEVDEQFLKANVSYLKHIANTTNKLLENPAIRSILTKMDGKEPEELPLNGQWDPNLINRIQSMSGIIQSIQSQEIETEFNKVAASEVNSSLKNQFVDLGASFFTKLPLVELSTDGLVEERIAEIGGRSHELKKDLYAFKEQFPLQNLMLALDVNASLAAEHTTQRVVHFLNQYMDAKLDPELKDPHNKDFINASAKAMTYNKNPAIFHSMNKLVMQLPFAVQQRIELKRQFPDAEVPEAKDLEKALDTLGLKKIVENIAEAKHLPDITPFKIQSDPYNPLEKNFIKSLSDIYKSAEKLGLHPDQIESKADEFIKNILDDKEVSETVKEEIKKLSLPQDKIRLLLEKGFVESNEQATQIDAILTTHFALEAYAKKYPETGKAIKNALNQQTRELIENPDARVTTTSKFKGSAQQSGTEGNTEPGASNADTTSSLAILASELYPVAFAAKILRVQSVFGDDRSNLNNVVYDLPTQQRIADFIGGAFENYAQAGLDTHLTFENETYEIVTNKNDENYGKIYHLEKNSKGDWDRGNIITDFKDPKNLAHQAQNPHKALLAMMDIYGDRYVPNVHENTERRSKALAKKIAEKFGSSDYAEEIRDSLRGKTLDEFKTGPLYRKLSESNDPDLDSLILQLWVLENHGGIASPSGEVNASYADQYESVFGLLDFMASGDGYNFDTHQKFRNTLSLEVGYLAHKDAYTILQMRGAVDPVLVYGEGKIPEDKQGYAMTKADVAAYVRGRMIEEAQKLGLSENEISDALMGQHKDSHGNTVHFMPYIGDLKLAFETVGKPPENDKEVWDNIARLANSGTKPPLDFLLNNIPDEAVQTFTGKSKSELIRLKPDAKNEIRDALMHRDMTAPENQGIKSAIMDYYEYYMGGHTHFRAPLWNKQFGQPADLPLHAYMRVNWNHLDKTYDGLLQEDFTMTTDQAIEKLRGAGREDLVSKLNQNLEGYKDYNVVTFLELENRPDGVYGIGRRNHFDRQKDSETIKLREEAASTPPSASPEPPEPPEPTTSPPAAAATR